MTGKFGANAHPSINETNTHTDEELLSPGFRQGVERLKVTIRKAAVAQSDLDIGTFWAAIHELAAEILEVDKGNAQAEMYWSKLEEFAEWQMQQPVNGSKLTDEQEDYFEEEQDQLYDEFVACTGREPDDDEIAEIYDEAMEATRREFNLGENK
jgi:hypothetical protein